MDLKYDAASNAELTMQNGGSGDAGDIYTGLDRFGRLVETIWKTASAELVHTTYGRNRVGGVTWQRNVLAHAMSPTTAENTRQDNFYWYDNLQQNYQHQRGDLAGTAPNYTGITNLQQTEVRSFDETGNWLTDHTTSPSLTQSRTHNKANEIATLTGPTGVTAPAFNAVGNMTSMPKPGAWTTGCTLTWDAWNRLVSFTDGTVTVTNLYDALTRRIRKSITGGEVRDYYYDKQWRSIEERLTGTFSGPDKYRYVWSPFDRWTLIRRGRYTGGTLTDSHYCLKDYLDPAAVITTAGTVAERFGYDAFGPLRFMDGGFVTHSTSTTDWNFLFHAEFLDNESGLYNYGYRFYNPYLGRWLSRDPIGEDGGLNLYEFSGNSAPNSVDALGLILFTDPICYELKPSEEDSILCEYECTCPPGYTHDLAGAFAKKGNGWSAGVTFTYTDLCCDAKGPGKCFRYPKTPVPVRRPLGERRRIKIREKQPRRDVDTDIPWGDIVLGIGVGLLVVSVAIIAGPELVALALIVNAAKGSEPTPPPAANPWDA